MEIRKNDEFELTIEDMSEDGAGIGKQDGYIWFVKDAVIGDRIRARAMKMKKNYGFARLMEVLEASKDRVMPECPVARQCGGCQLQMMSYEAQLHFKERKVYNNLRRIGGMENLRLPEQADEVSVPENVSERNTSERMETTDAGVKAENVWGKVPGKVWIKLSPWSRSWGWSTRGATATRHSFRLGAIRMEESLLDFTRDAPTILWKRRIACWVSKKMR